MNFNYKQVPGSIFHSPQFQISNFLLSNIKVGPMFSDHAGSQISEFETEQRRGLYFEELAAGPFSRSEFSQLECIHQILTIIPVLDPILNRILPDPRLSL